MSDQDPPSHETAEQPEESRPDELTAFQAVLIQPVNHWLSGTTAHGLDRLLDNERPVYMKLVWLAGFCLGLAVFVLQVQVFIDNYSQKPETTTLKQSSVEFTFPDVYICNKAIASGSYSYLINRTNISLINNYTNQLLALIGVPISGPQAAHFAKSLLASIPYSLLSDNLGQNVLQLVFSTFLNGMMNEVAFSTFHSPKELNCVRFNLTDEQRSLLSTVGSYFEISLFLDVSFFSFPKTSSLLPIPLRTGDAYDFLTWDFLHGVNLESTSGVNLYFASPGFYPDDDSLLQLSAGKDYQVNLEVSRISLGKGMSCSANPQPRRIKSPYDGAETSFSYSQYLCTAERSNELLLQTKGCISHLLPRDSKFANATKCLDFGRVLSGQLSAINFATGLYSNADPIMSLNQKEIQQYCYALQPCESDRYLYTYSFGDWPRIFSSFQRQILTRFQNIAQQKTIQSRNTRFPGYVDMDSIINGILNNATTSNIVIGTGYFKDQVMRVRISPSKSLGSSVQIEKSYELVNLISDTGGLLGLYVGASVLTVLEVLELLHDCLAGCFILAASRSLRRRHERSVAPAVSQISLATAAEASGNISNNSRDTEGHEWHAREIELGQIAASLSIRELEREIDG